MCWLVDRVFDDKRLAVTVLMVWLAIVLVIFKEIGLLDSGYMSFGPSAKTVFMGVVLDTWNKWSLVAVFTFLNTCMNDFFSDAISPWILNTITDHKGRYLPYPPLICLLVSQLWAVYVNVMSVFGLKIALSQIYFVLVRLLADLMVNTYTNLKFMRFKTHDPEKYYNLDGHCPGSSGSQSELKVFTVDTPESDPI